jgi:hypothetical protein
VKKLRGKGAARLAFPAQLVEITFRAEVNTEIA